jgi:asparagine synthase (glutamine-hydrolysing)
MCGIVGFINCGDFSQLSKSISLIKHRGPDKQVVKWFPQFNSGIAHARLSIIDLSEAGSQPMFDESSGNWIVYNGEVYNFITIREELISLGWKFNSSSDTEVVLKAFCQWGKKSLNRFNGMFVFAIYNQNSGHLFIGRDRLGIKPLYYYRCGNKIVFASEIKSILAYKGYPKEPDLFAIQTPIHFQASPSTGFKEIYKLEAGHLISVDNLGFIIEKYWDIYPTESDISFRDAYDKLDYLIQDSISLQMISDVPIGSLLSGGLDSSLISVLMQKKLTQAINTFTIKFKSDDLKRQGNVDDSYYAQKLAMQFGFNHHEITIEPDIIDLLPKLVWHMDEPIADPAALNTYLISDAAQKNGIKVLLSGMGADEFFSGYRSHLACLKAESYQKLPNTLRKTIECLIKKFPESNKKVNYKYIRWAKSFLKVASLPQLDRLLLIKNSALNSDSFNEYYLNSIDFYKSTYVSKETNLFEQYPNLSYLTKICYCDTKTYLPDHNLTYSDKAMMAASVEGRPALLDHRIVEFMFTLKPNYRINGNTQKYLLKKVAEKHLPKEIIYRPKAPFSAPLRGWLKKELKEMVQDILSYDSISRRGIYNPKFVMKLIDQNNRGMEDNSQLIWRLMVNEIWFRTFIDNEV